jgi:hypothetical protein
VCQVRGKSAVGNAIESELGGILHGFAADARATTLSGDDE